MSKSKKRVSTHRSRARAKGGVIVYAMLTDPQAIKAWQWLQETYGSNRDAIEAAIIDSYESLSGNGP